ncbi:hypothetical protein QQF64_010851 [Cirrhinus molitorella]|uniref:Uncharacterized protein n=1 Tax=Cirrhinus molitorella TaxID=172907 RepID=A0ABR3M162_9TELE
MFSQQEVGSSGQKFVSFSQTNTHTATSYSHCKCKSYWPADIFLRVTGWHHPGSTQVFADRKLSVLPIHYSVLAGQAFNHRPPSAQLEAKMKLRDSDDTKSQLLESPQHQYSKNISTEQPSKPYKVTDRFHKDTKI